MPDLDADGAGYRLAHGDQHALAEVYQAMGPAVLAFARRHVGDADAEDVVQKVFTDVWRGASRYDPGQPLAAWVFTIARRRVVDELRRRKTTVVPLESVRELVDDSPAAVADFEDAATVRGLLTRLSDEQRQVIELVYFGGLSLPEVAQRTGAPLGTVKARSARGLRRLAALLEGSEDR